MVVVLTCVVSCDKEPITRFKDKMDIKVLHEASEETDTPKQFSILCIDGVKYLRTPEGGITVKYQANQEGDPSAEECE
jgi:hypothetical protein